MFALILDWKKVPLQLVRQHNILIVEISFYFFMFLHDYEFIFIMRFMFVTG